MTHISFFLEDGTRLFGVQDTQSELVPPSYGDTVTLSFEERVTGDPALDFAPGVASQIKARQGRYIVVERNFQYRILSPLQNVGVIRITVRALE